MSILTDIRKKLAQNGQSEIVTMDDQPALVEMWERLQDLRDEMNTAKKTAAAEAAKPYLEVIEQVEKRYAMLLRLSS